MNQIPKLRPGFRFQWEPVQNAHVLLYPEGMVKLNESASAILSEVNGESTVAEIVERLENRFPEAGALEGDVCEFLDDARQQHWIMMV
ncbi:pyrroloquinoline quinone biosynthesis protein D [Marinobacter daqiaonensis]|uniref:PqqA binding protein n=1 Tax=Marinobacter daqiaonensis TaxID=650891 RepID=A0A1I6HYD3_9GAMM|nr:pyrroloquinoline quinone biosynthesis peptide chaperone PqqD [Marinobacter daqiaonensis]SFR59475.1 pyrroloquinoline quinone biosynthesis protein D [Marinobacter daqiaonensis]